MAKIDRLGWAAGISFKSYGLRMGVRVNDPEALSRVTACLPPGWSGTSNEVVEYLYSLWIGKAPRAGVRPYHLLYLGAGRLARTLELEQVLETLETEIAHRTASLTEERVFLHAGVVGWRGAAILLPGPSHAGKSTLVAELVRAGATYYSDEYAVLDRQGRVHPYPRSLSLRKQEEGPPQRCPVSSIGGQAGTQPLPVGLVVVTRYAGGRQWRPRRLPAGEACLALVGNAVAARLRTEAVLHACRQVAMQAVTLQGHRGEAQDAARLILTRSNGEWAPRALTRIEHEHEHE